MSNVQCAPNEEVLERLEPPDTRIVTCSERSVLFVRTAKLECTAHLINQVQAGDLEGIKKT